MKRPFFIAAVWTLLCALPMGAATTTDNLERQFRVDLSAFIRAKGQRPVEEELSKAVEALAAQVKSSFPGILVADSKTETPSEEALQRAYSDLQHVGAGAPSPVLVSFYAELWRAKLLKPDQAIIFDRLMRAIASSVEKQKNEKNG